MNQSTDNLEDFFHQSFNDEEKVQVAADWNVPSEVVWENIQNGLTEEKKLNVLFIKWPWSAIAASYLLLVGGYQFFQKQTLGDDLDTFVVVAELVLDTHLESEEIVCTDEFIRQKQLTQSNRYFESPDSKWISLSSPDDKNEIQSSRQKLAVATISNIKTSQLYKTTKLSKNIDELTKSIQVLPNLESSYSTNFLTQDIQISKITPALKKPTTFYVAANYNNLSEDLKKYPFSKENQTDLTVAETSNKGFGVGIQMGVENKKGWAIETGIHYTQIAENREVNQTIKHQDLQNNIAANGNGVGDLQLDWTNSAEKNELVLAFKNNGNTPINATDELSIEVNQQTQKSFVEVPFLLKKRWKIGKVGLSLKSGVLNRFQINHTLTEPKITLDNNQFELLATEFKQNISTAKNKIYIPQLVAGLGLEYFIQPNLSVYVEPTFTKSIASLIDFDFAQATAPNSMVNVGFRYEL